MSEITQLLQEWKGGDRHALDLLLPKIYENLRRIAHAQLRKERPGHTLQSAALVNEAYLRLAGVDPAECPSRTHFFAIAASLMRHVLVDYARNRKAAKRGGNLCKVSFDEALIPSPAANVDVLVLDEALRDLARLDERQSRVVELRFFAGLSLEEIADALGIAPATVQRDWTIARAWLYRRISGDSRP